MCFWPCCGDGQKRFIVGGTYFLNLGGNRNSERRSVTSGGLVGLDYIDQPVSGSSYFVDRLAYDSTTGNLYAATRGGSGGVGAISRYDEYGGSQLWDVSTGTTSATVGLHYDAATNAVYAAFGLPTVTVRKYRASDGAVVLSIDEADGCGGVAVDSQERIIAATNDNATVIRYDQSGSTIVSVTSGTLPTNLPGNGRVQVGSDDSIYVSHQYDSPSAGSIFVRKYDSSLSLVWESSDYGTGLTSGGGTLSLSPDGSRVYLAKATGISNGASNSLVALDADDGSELWVSSESRLSFVDSTNSTVVAVKNTSVSFTAQGYDTSGNVLWETDVLSGGTRNTVLIQQ